jgi:hypothetical protein
MDLETDILESTESTESIESTEKREKREKQARWNLYNKKFKKSLSRIVFYGFIAITFIVFIFGLNLYRSTLLDFDKKNITELEKYIKVIKNESRDTTNNLNLAKKYNKKWTNASKNQKNTDGISPKLINDIIGKLVKKYHIGKYDFQMSVPERLDGKKQIIGIKKTLEAFSSTCSVSFNISDDIKSVNFLKDLRSSLTGYTVISSISISKTKLYQFEDLVKISTGENSGLVNIQISFNWYTMKKAK